MNEREKLIYLAGFLDGEGSITGWCANDQKKRGVYNLKIYITSTSLEVIQWIKSNFGGLVYENNAPSRKPHWKKAYIWCLERKRTKEFLESIHPFLIIKKQQAKIAIQLRKTFDKKYKPLPKEVTDRRFDLICQLKSLNARNHI